MFFDCTHFLVAPPQQEHEEDGTEQNGERAHGGNHDLSYHLHVAGQRVCKAYTHINNSVELFLLFRHCL